ncbi:MAG: hypothetical protein Q8881_02460 [Sweet potato little leaf phytoplasma]|nr:hypothetical protein [Sweet potato little leaf phytoplasma]
MNFALRDVSAETAEFLPNFAVWTIPTKRPNFYRISHSGVFPPKWPNQSRRISTEFRTRDVSAETAESIPPNFALGDISDETAEHPPNFALVDVSNEIAEFRT